jgi:L-asparaginase
MRKHIYIAYTGGTIGMKPSPQGYIPVAGFLSNTLANMPEFHRHEMPDFTVHEYAQLMDSSDMSPTDWQTIANDIQSNYHKYDGFIILHGTDTMAYTASALSFMLENLGKPVIVTGSQIPLAELRSDGQVNLLNALFVAANYPIHEVSLYFNNQLLRGNRSRKLDADGFGAFQSPNFPALLEAGINIAVNAGTVAEISHQPLSVNPITAQPIGMVTLYPGICAEVILNSVRQPVKALILLTYGVGNAPQNPQLINALKLAIDQGIVVVNCSQCTRGRVNMSGYATGNVLREIGVLSCQDMTPEATLTKLHHLLSLGLDSSQVKIAFEQNLKGELTAHDDTCH